MTAFRPDGTAPKGRGRSRQRILDAALQAFSRKGYHDTRMEEIAALAGVAKGTLYYGFPSKADLFAELVCAGMDQFLETLDREVVSDLPFPQHFRRLVGVHVDLLFEYRDLFVIAAHPANHGFPWATVSRIEAARDRYVAHAAGMIRQGQALGYLRDCDADLMAAQVLGMMDGLLRYGERATAPLDRERLADQMHRLLADGLLAPRGAKGGGA